MSLTPKVDVVLDRPRYLRFNMSAMSAFDKKTGVDFLHKGFDASNLDMGQLQALLWSCLLEEDPELTMAQVGDMVDMSNLVAVTGLVMQCVTGALPEQSTEVEVQSDPNAASLSA